MSKLLERLLKLEGLPEEEVYMPRFEESFKLRAMEAGKAEKLRDQCTNNGIVDENQLEALVIAETCVDPNFKDEALLDKFETSSPRKVINSLLLPGEISRLRVAVLRVNGFMDSEGEVKN